MLINSKLRSRYILVIVTNSGNSATQGPHHVAQILISLSLSDLLLINPLMPSALMVSSLTGSLAHSTAAFSIQVLFSAHFTEQPKTLVVATGTSLLFNKASIEFRASKTCGVRYGFSTSSIRPW